MKKRIMAIAMAATLVVGLSACGSSASGTTSTATDAAAAGSTAEAEEATGEAEATEEAGPDYSSVKMGFITLHDENSTYDLNFINAAKEASEELGFELMLKTNIGEDAECYETACELAEDGCNIIFADSFGHESYMIEAAMEYPDVQFCHATGTRAHTENLANYHNAFASIYEGRFLAGVVAGMKLNEMIENGEITEDEAKMGYVGAFTYAEVISGYTSYYLGAKYICPSATMDVTFTGSWYDETAEKEGATKLIDGGCVLISQHADSMGAPTACEDAGVPDVSYNGSTEAAAPNTFLVSSRINWVPYLKSVVEAVVNGTEIPVDYTGTIETGSVELSDLGKIAVAEGTAEKLEEIKAGLEDGSIKVFDTATFTVGGEAVESYMADVDTDENYEGDTEVIIDGAFVESGADMRSAPYFDLQIDGITLLDQAF